MPTVVGDDLPDPPDDFFNALSVSDDADGVGPSQKTLVDSHGGNGFAAQRGAVHDPPKMVLEWSGLEPQRGFGYPTGMTWPSVLTLSLTVFACNLAPA